MKDKKAIYLVLKGRKPGIYAEWQGEKGAFAQISGFTNALYKKFKTAESALEWLRDFPETPVITAIRSDLEKRSNEKKGEIKGFDNKEDENKVLLYTDGACKSNPGPGGYGVIFSYKKHYKELSGGYRLTTNNRMELMACIVGLETLKYPCNVVIYSDSAYVIKAVNHNWLKKWLKNGFILSTGKPVENSDLWKRFSEISRNHTIEFRWVKGHAGISGNERADELAATAAKQKSLPPDDWYEAHVKSKKNNSR